MLKWIFKKTDGGMNWIDLARDMYRWRALVNAAMDRGVPKNAENF
jgi:hypothetical protein